MKKTTLSLLLTIALGSSSAAILAEKPEKSSAKNTEHPTNLRDEHASESGLEHGKAWAGENEVDKDKDEDNKSQKEDKAKQK